MSPAGPLERQVGKLPISKLIFMSSEQRIAELRPAIEQTFAGRASLTTAIPGMLEVGGLEGWLDGGNARWMGAGWRGMIGEGRVVLPAGRCLIVLHVVLSLCACDEAALLAHGVADQRAWYGATVCVVALCAAHRCCRWVPPRAWASAGCWSGWAWIPQLSWRWVMVSSVVVQRAVHHEGHEAATERSPEAGRARTEFRLSCQLGCTGNSPCAGENDKEMLELCGLGVAMGNAAPAALSVADAITAKNAEDGVARALERFVLGPRGLL